MYTYNLDTMGERLKQLRKQQNMSQQKLADALRVTRSCIANWESNKREIDICQWKHIAHIFNISIDYLCGQNEINIHTGDDRIDLSRLNQKGIDRLMKYYAFLLSSKEFIQ